MPRIVISYRRDDTDVMAGRIRDRLADHYGEAAVFMLKLLRRLYLGKTLITAVGVRHPAVASGALAQVRPTAAQGL